LAGAGDGLGWEHSLKNDITVANKIKKIMLPKSST
jgi:hypothetical protein